MVNVTWQRSPEQLRARAQRMLPVLIRYWQEFPAIAAEIDSWDDGEAQIYIEEWRHAESKRYDIERSAEAGILTADQMHQLAELRALVAEHKPTLDRLLGI